MQQYKNPYDHEARAEQFGNAPESTASENAGGEGMVSEPSAGGDRTIEIVEENEAGQAPGDAGAAETQTADPSAGGQADTAALDGDDLEDETPLFSSAQEQDATQASADTQGQAGTDGQTDTQGADQAASGTEESLEGDVQYTGPLFGAAAAQAESEEMAALKAEMENMRLRQAAEMENFKKRLAREHQEQMLYASEKILRDLLPTLDNLELAMQYGNTSEVCKDLLTGVSMTHKLLLDCVQKYGLLPVGTVGEVFDPAIHEAVGFDQHSDQEKGSVARVLQRGYKLGNRLLRAARVMISQPAEQA